MTSRVNVKFVLALLLIMGVVAGIAGILFYVQIRQDASRNAAMADEYFEQGDIDKAREFYGKAVRREPGNRQYLDKYEKTLLMAVPDSIDRARELYQQRMTVFQHAAQHFPLEPDAHIRLLEELHRGGRLRLGRGYLEQLESAAENMLDRVHVSEEKHAYGRLYRALARFKLRDMYAVYTVEDLEPTEDDLLVFLESFPDSDLGWATLVMGQWRSAQQLEIEGQTRRAEEKFEEANASLRRAMEQAPDGLEMAKARLQGTRLRIQRETRGRDAISDELADQYMADLEQAIDHLLTKITPEAPPWSVLEAMDYLQQILRGRYDEDVEAAFLEYQKSHEQHPLLRLAIAEMLYTWGKYDQAEQQAQALLDAEPMSVDLVAQLQFAMRPNALGMIVDIEYQRWRDATSAQEKQQHLQAMKSALDELSEAALDKTGPTMLRAEGKVAFVEENYVVAAQKFEALLKSNQRESEKAETLAFAVHCHEELDNVGLAHERVSEALELRPNNVQLLAKKAQLELRMRRYADAEQTAREGLELAPESEVLQRMLTLAESRGDVTGENLDDPVAMAVAGAREAWQNGETESARSMLLAELERSPDDIRLLDMLARMEFAEGNRETAIDYVNRAIELRPDLTPLQQLKAQMENEDPIEAMKAVVAAMQKDEGEAVAAMIVGLHSLQRFQENRADELDAEGKTDEAATARTLASRADAELKKYVARAEQLIPDHVAVIEYKIREAVMNEQWDKAEQSLQRARELNLDGANGDLYAARYQIVRGNHEEAVRILLSVTQRMEYSATVWNTLGLAYEQLGNFNEAVRAYGQAYRCDPTRLDVLRAFTRVLLQTGERQRALDVVRQARRIAPRDTTFREIWLELEAEVGDAGVAMLERREIYEANPDDRANAIRLASLLGRTDPGRALIMDASGEPRYNEQQWVRLNSNERRRIIQETRSRWQSEADAIVDRLAAETDESDLQIALLRAQLLRGRGDASAGEQVLRDFIAGVEQSQRTAEMYLALGRYLDDVNRPREAASVYSQGLEYQDEEARSVDIALGDLYFNQNMKEEALRHFDRVLEKNDNVGVQLRAIECLVDLDRLDEAEDRLGALEQERGADFTTWMLHAAIAERRSELHAEAGREVEAEYELEQYRTALENAQELRPSSVLPKLRVARHLMKEYSRTGKRSVLDDALRTLDEADQLAANDPRVSLLRIDIFRALNDTRGAVNELRRLVEREPDDDRSRRLLVQMLMQQNDVDGAIRVVEDAIARNETSAVWLVQLGDLYLNSKNQPREALEAYMRALNVQPTPALVAQIARVRLAVGEDASATVRFIEQYPQFLGRSDVVVAYARALGAANRQGDVRELLARIYRATDERIEQGEASPTSIGAWFQMVGKVVPVLSVAEVEELVLELSEQNPTAFELSSLAYLWRSRAQSKSEISHALALQRQAVSMIGDEDPVTQSPYYYDLGTMLLGLGEFNAAAEAFKTCAEKNPDHVLAINNWAYLLAEKLGEPQKALPLAEKAVTMSPDNPSVLDTAGWINFKVGNMDKAEQYLRESLKQQETPETLVHLAEVLINRGELNDALDGPLRRAEELQPSDQTQAEIDRLLADIRTRQERGQ